MLEILNTIVTTILLYGFYAFLAVFAFMCVVVLLGISLYFIPFILGGFLILLIFDGQGLWALIPLFLIIVWYGIVQNMGKFYYEQEKGK